jgi:predicted nucleic acid-binding Zn ribbon protein
MKERRRRCFVCAKNEEKINKETISEKLKEIHFEIRNRDRKFKLK